MTTLESNRCYACGKLFCCASCCTEHIRKKHPGRESKCPLCRSERLLVKDFENEEFLCHVVFHHLPLRCRLCNDQFNNSDDLRCLGACSRRSLNRARFVVQEESNKSILSPETPPLNQTPCDPSRIKRKDFSIEGDYNGNFGNFTSPPELSRNTSTPMHVNLASNQHFKFKTPRSPFFTFKTPKTASASIKNPRRNENSIVKENSAVKQDSVSSVKELESTNSESVYYSLSSPSRAPTPDNRTPLRSILSNQSMCPDNSREYSTSRSTERKHGPMQDIDEEMGIEKIEPEDMDLTDIRCNVIAEGQVAENSSQRASKEHRDSVKRVRFSDQFQVTGFNETEEFFEARQSLSNDMSIVLPDKLSSSAALNNDENEKNAKKEVEAQDPTPQSPPQVVQGEQEPVQSSSATASSSRVVMMLVIENNNGSVGTTDLAPLINSSLKKLENVVAPGAIPRGIAVVPPPPAPPPDRPATPGSTVLSVDSYMSVSTVECYSTPNSTTEFPTCPKDASDNPSGGGIFSAVAQAMRTAFRTFSSTSTTRSITNESGSPRENPALMSSRTDSGATSSGVLTSLASALVPRATKRSRDADESPTTHTTEASDSQIDIRSPVPKRPRGWYKIRGREPIARMRNDSVTSPRGVSSETQCFSQGMLSIGDTILPIPSRAHRSTQTD